MLTAVLNNARFRLAEERELYVENRTEGEGEARNVVVVVAGVCVCVCGGGGGVSYRLKANIKEICCPSGYGTYFKLLDL